MSLVSNRKRPVFSILIAGCFLSLGLLAESGSSSKPERSLSEVPVRTPLGFEVNCGQFEPGVRYVTRSDDFLALFRDDGIQFRTADGKRSLGGLTFQGASRVEPFAAEEGEQGV